MQPEGVSKMWQTRGGTAGLRLGPLGLLGSQHFWARTNSRAEAWTELKQSQRRSFPQFTGNILPCSPGQTTIHTNSEQPSSLPIIIMINLAKNNIFWILNIARNCIRPYKTPRTSCLLLSRFTPPSQVHLLNRDLAKCDWKSKVLGDESPYQNS